MASSTNFTNPRWMGWYPKTISIHKSIFHCFWHHDLYPSINYAEGNSYNQIQKGIYQFSKLSKCQCQIIIFSKSLPILGVIVGQIWGVIILLFQHRLSKNPK